MRRSIPLIALAAAGLLAGCGGADPPPPSAAEAARSAPPKAFDPVPAMTDCLAGLGVKAERTSAYDLVLEPRALGMRIRFAATPADADATQLRGEAEGAEVVRRVIFYPGEASDAELDRVEQCVNSVASAST